MSDRFKNIISNPEILGAKPVIKGTRISVEMILEWLATGATVNQIAEKHKNLSIETINEAILFAAHFFQNEILIEVENVA